MLFPDFLLSSHRLFDIPSPPVQHLNNHRKEATDKEIVKVVKAVVKRATERAKIPKEMAKAMAAVLKVSVMTFATLASVQEETTAHSAIQ